MDGWTAGGVKEREVVVRVWPSDLFVVRQITMTSCVACPRRGTIKVTPRGETKRMRKMKREVWSQNRRKRNRSRS